MGKLIASRSEPITLVATSRQGKEINQRKLGNQKSKVVYHKLDITSQESIKEFTNFIEKEFGRVDILINNAGVTFEEPDNSTFSPEVVRKTFDTSK